MSTYTARSAAGTPPRQVLLERTAAFDPRPAHNATPHDRVGSSVAEGPEPLPPFQHLVDEHWRDVARLAHALAPGHGDDVAQQAWTQALAAYPRLTHARNLRSWLLTITHRCAMDHHRTARRSTPHEDPSLLTDAPTLPPPEAPDGELWARVGALPPRQRDAVVLRFVGDLDHRAVAAALGTSPGMSRRLVSDAIATLRLDLQDQS